MRAFKLVRNEDETGVSGIGVVAEGCQFSTGVCVLCWLNEQLSLKIYNSIEDVERVHGHGGKTVIEWELQVGDPIVFEDGNHKNRFGQTKINGILNAIYLDSYGVVLFGMVGPGDETVIKGVPAEYVKAGR